MKTEQPEALRIADDLRHSIAHYGREDAFTLNAYEAEERLRALHAENDALRAGYDAARLEIASLRERVQMLGQLARDVNSRRVLELEAQLEAVGAGGVGALMAAPNGWQLVPAEPTKEMERAMAAQFCGTVDEVRRAWAEGIAAAPQPPAQAQEDAKDAARYRFLRDNRNWHVTYRIRPGNAIEYAMVDECDRWGPWWPTHEQAIDAAIAAQKENHD